MVQLVTNGIKIGEYRPDDSDDEIDIRVRFPYDKRDLGRIETLRIKTIHGQIPISHFVENTPVPKVDTIKRVDSRRVMTVNADMRPGELLSLALPRLQQKLEQQGMDPRVKLKIRGENEEQDEQSDSARPSDTGVGSSDARSRGSRSQDENRLERRARRQ